MEQQVQRLLELVLVLVLVLEQVLVQPEPVLQPKDPPQVRQQVQQPEQSSSASLHSSLHPGRHGYQSVRGKHVHEEPVQSEHCLGLCQRKFDQYQEQTSSRRRYQAQLGYLTIQQGCPKRDACYEDHPELQP
jgi:hypothetical protein